jgi:hypothetical protein
MGRRRGQLVALTALAATVGVVGAATIGSAATTCAVSGPGCPAPTEIEFGPPGFRVTPRLLPAGKPAPIAFSGEASISTVNGTHPSALREAAVDVERDVIFDVAGLPACGYRQLATRESDAARRVCRPAIVGSGTAVIELSYPENKPIALKTEVILFNGGPRGRATRLFLHGFLPIPRPRALVARVTLEPAPGGGGGGRATVEIPRASDGHGSLIEFALTVRRTFRAEDGRKGSFVSARCPDGKFKVTMPKLVFRNEVGVPGVPPQTFLKGSALVPCTPAR